MPYKPLSLAFAVATILGTTLPQSVFADEAIDCGDEQRCLEHLIVTGDVMRQPVHLVSDPKQNRLPLPAYDGSGFLRSIPGFNITRKGGSGGDPTFRGQGGSRLSIVDDGQHVYGACGGRMDPPTNYIYPEAYDQITVIKGPQTVKYGPVGTAGTILFEKDRHRFSEADIEGRASATAGSFERRDSIIELTGGDKNYYVDFDMNQSSSDHYQDGNGNKVQSSYDRKSSNIALGWTPSERTVLELAYGESSGSAEYADRLNKARQIDNRDVSLLLQHDFDSTWLKSMEAQAFSNKNDHIMDRFDEGVNAGSNVRRMTQGGHLWFELTPLDPLELTLGVDYMASEHDGRSIAAGDNGLDDLLQKPFKEDMRYYNYGVFAESVYRIDNSSLHGGLRYDQWNTELLIAQQGERDDSLFSGYLRYEYVIDGHQYYAGVGTAKRMPDYWEFMKSSVGNSAQKAFELAPETTNQLDIGWIYQGPIETSVSLFYGQIDDYILIDATGPASVARNIDATLYGGEASVDYALNEQWSAQLTLSYTRGENDTDNVALGQISPLEARLTVNYQWQNWTMAAQWRGVAAQERYTLGQGNIVGQDLGESRGFGTLALNASWSYSKALSVIIGVENLFDVTYAEHVSKAGSGNDLPGSEAMFRVNEPGRNLWAKLNYRF
ncbi:MAG: TonB-dependent copper receptor [Shewanella sp.]|uniref:TonB-dependent copper receptor n=1 Tax=Shewanella sp. TaxID=50422 RepID=UPI003F3FAD81